MGFLSINTVRSAAPLGVRPGDPDSVGLRTGHAPCRGWGSCRPPSGGLGVPEKTPSGPVAPPWRSSKARPRQARAAWSLRGESVPVPGKPIIPTRLRSLQGSKTTA